MVYALMLYSWYPQWFQSSTAMHLQPSEHHSALVEANTGPSNSTQACFLYISEWQSVVIYAYVVPQAHHV